VWRPFLKTVAIVQSSYIPWKGYFDLIRRVDEFILYDDVQYTRRDWRNRNRIKSPNGPLWLTIPVEVKGRYLQAIKDTKISDRRWNERHWNSIRASYARAPYYGAYKAVLEDLYLGCESASLSEVNFRFLSRLCALLSIGTRLSWSMDYANAETGTTERLVALCRLAGATEYVSGPSARSYIDPGLFADAGIVLTFMNYDGYPEYGQLYPPFDHQVSIIDLLVHTGPDAVAHLLPRPARSLLEPTA
jgi:WbqC-like protein family